MSIKATRWDQPSVREPVDELGGVLSGTGPASMD
jgi:hypothetical protein